MVFVASDTMPALFEESRLSSKNTIFATTLLIVIVNR
jgi:hypothetical protein